MDEKIIEIQTNQSVPMDTTNSVLGSLDPNTRTADYSVCEPMEATSVQGDSGPNVTEVTIPTDEEDALLESVPNTQQSSQAEVRQTKGAEGRLKLPGSARKRLKLYLKEGMSIEKARELCLKPMKEVRNELGSLHIPRKRGRSGGSSPDKPNPPKRATGSTVTGANDTNKADDDASRTTGNFVQPTYKDMVDVIRLGVIPPDFPKNVWSEDKLKLIQSAVLDKIVELKKGSIKPQFAGCSFKSGWLTFNCKGVKSAEWVREHVPSLKPWQDAVLRVVPEVDVPRAEVFIGYFPVKPDTSTNRILSLIEGQNDDLSVEVWRVLNRVNKGDIAELTFAIDPNSAATLRKKNNHIGYGYGTVHIRPTNRRHGAGNDVPRSKEAGNRSSQMQPDTAKVGDSAARSVKLAGSVSAKRSAGPVKGKLVLPDKDEVPSCSKKHTLTTGGKSNAGRSEPSRRPRKGHSTSEEESVLLSSNRGRKMAARSSRK